MSDETPVTSVLKMDRAEPLGNSLDDFGRRALHVKGAFRFSGLNIGMRITTMEIGDTATAIPATPFTQRNAIAILNLDPALTLYVGPSSVTEGRTVGTTAGWEVGPSEAFNVDITDGVVVYGIAPAGETILVKILEIA
jgi:hypothetical protein